MTLVVILQAGALFALALSRGGGMPLALRLVLALVAAEALGVSIVALAQRGATRRARKERLLGELAAEVNRAILLNEDEGRIFSTILNYAFRILENVNLGSVLALNECGELVIAASQGFSQDFVKGFRLRLEDSFQYRQSGGNICEAMIIRPEIIKGFADRLDSSDREYRSIISAPLFVDGRLYGFLNVDSLRAGCFGADDLALLKKFASQIEVCLLARERYRASLAESRVDGLTGFLTRSRFDEILDHAIKHAERYGGTFTIGMFDVDGLKAVNDGLGHPAGDLVLAAVADSIRRMARKSDILGRYGGDEFVAVYFASDAAAMGERTRRNLADLASGTVSFAGRALPASYCFGFADFPADSRDRAGLVAVADARLYAMKASRRA